MESLNNIVKNFLRQFLFERKIAVNKMKKNEKNNLIYNIYFPVCFFCPCTASASQQAGYH